MLKNSPKEFEAVQRRGLCFLNALNSTGNSFRFEDSEANPIKLLNGWEVFRRVRTKAFSCPELVMILLKFPQGGSDGLAGSADCGE